MQRMVRRSIISGRVRAPPSQSAAHRALLISSLAGGQSVLSNVPSAPDISATINACNSIGADIIVDSGVADIFGMEEISLPARVDCASSNTTLKLLLPLAAATGQETTFIGSGTLAGKPLEPFSLYLEKIGATTGSETGHLPLKVRGPIEESQLLYPALLGTQFLSGLLIAAPLRGEETEIGIVGSLASEQPLDSTVELMRLSGINFGESDSEAFTMMGGQEYSPLDGYEIPASAYLSSFVLLAGAISGNVEVSGAGSYPEFESLLKTFGATFRSGEGKMSASVGELHRAEMDAASLGNLLPHALVLAALGREESKFANLRALGRRGDARARLIARELSRMGATVTETSAGLFISGGRLNGAVVEPEGDPKAAMALSAAATAANGATTISGSECVDRAYPGFFRDLAQVGALIR
ncbi:3-phosphoshikimate 1-carboxyvinyltransferase [uncultured archaeon]|nr:3-phosphoshikimate 1-carboxyvinyltransferase [uncultured archaeon]